MDQFHGRDHRLKGKILPDLQSNMNYVENVMKNCDDLVKKQFFIGSNHDLKIYAVYMDGLVNAEMLQESVLRPMLQEPFENGRKAVEYWIIESADWNWISDMEEAMVAVLSGNTVLFLDGFHEAVLISTKFFPTRGIQNADQEVSMVGPKDSFNESLRTNTALIRRRIRDTRLKVVQKQIGTRSKTDCAVMYMEDLASQDTVEKIKEQLDEIYQKKKSKA